jgi:hypothetical protein
MICDNINLSGNLMPDRIDRERLNADLTLAWIFTGIMVAMLAVYPILCHTLGSELQQPLPETQRVFIRTVLYALAIVTFPVTNLLRHIQLRLNQTMPGDNPAKNRYLTTVIVSLSLIESIGIFGFIMFILGDSFNTLYIFTGMSALGLFLYRPKPDEYTSIITALSQQKHE